MRNDPVNIKLFSSSLYDHTKKGNELKMGCGIKEVGIEEVVIEGIRNNEFSQFLMVGIAE